MTDLSIVITMSGEQSIMLRKMLAVAKQNGWTEEVNGEPNPVTAMAKAESVFRNFFEQTVSAFETNEAVNVVRLSAAEQSAIEMKEITLTVTVA
jgi:hypothetical protein